MMSNQPERDTAKNMNRTNKISKTITLLLTAILIASQSLILTNCGEKYDISEIRPVAEELIGKSTELNEIYFGKGLEVMEGGELVEKFYSSFEFDIEAVNYHPVSEESPYQTEAELREATLEVFTEEYSEYLFERAFSGISAMFVNEDATEKEESVIYAMYIEDNGVLTARLDIDDEAIPLGRIYDMEKMEILRSRENYVVVKIPTTLDGVPLDIELKLVNTPNGWRLDSPTY